MTCQSARVTSRSARVTASGVSAQLGLKFFFAHAGLLGADVLHVEAKDARELGQVIGVAACSDQRQHLARADRGFLRLGGVALATSLLSLAGCDAPSSGGGAAVKMANAVMASIPYRK